MARIIFIFLIGILIFSNCSSSGGSQQQSGQIESTPTLEKATVVSYENLDVAAFQKEIKNNNDSYILDVRTPEEIANGQIEGAHSLNFYDKDFAEKLLELDRSKSYYVYCKGGGRSAKTARLMIKNGFSDVHNLEGGYTAWNAETKK